MDVAVAVAVLINKVLEMGTAKDQTMDAVLEKMTAADFDKMMDEAIKKQPLAQ